MTARKRDSEILMELRKPQEDSEIAQQKEYPDLERLPGLKLTGQALADLLMVFEFLHNFGETLGFGKLNSKYSSSAQRVEFQFKLIRIVPSQTWTRCHRFKVCICR